MLLSCQYCPNIFQVSRKLRGTFLKKKERWKIVFKMKEDHSQPLFVSSADFSYHSGLNPKPSNMRGTSILPMLVLPMCCGACPAQAVRTDCPCCCSIGAHSLEGAMQQCQPVSELAVGIVILGGEIWAAGKDWDFWQPLLPDLDFLVGPRSLTQRPRVCAC